MIELLSLKKELLILSSLAVLFVAASFFVIVVFLKHRGNRRSSKADKMLKKHKDLLKTLSEGQTTVNGEAIERLKRLGDSQLIEVFLDKAAEKSNNSPRQLREFYDAMGITGRYLDILKDSRVWKKRAFAAEKLGQIGSSKAVPVLLSIIRDVNNEDEDVRNTSLRALGKIKDMGAVPFLIEALGYPETWLPPRVGEILVNIGEESVEPLKKELKNFQSESRRGWAAEILGWLEAKSAAPALIESLFDVSPEVRAKAAGALGKIKSERAISRLTELLISEPVPYVRTRVSQALGAIGNPSVIHYLVNILKDPEWWVRVRAVEALEHIGEQSIPSLLVALEDEDAEVRKRAALALERIGYIEKIINEYGQDKYKPGLRKILFLVAQAGVIESLSEKLTNSEGPLKMRLVRLLGEAKTAEAAEPLIELLKTAPDWNLRARIIQSLGRIGAKQAVPLLIGSLKDNEYWVRKASVEALGLLEAAEFSGDIAAILEDPNPLARESALSALSMLKVTDHWEKIEKLLYDPSPAVRSAALRVMRELGIVTDKQKIIGVLNEASEEVRVEAIRYLSSLSDSTALMDIIRHIPLCSDSVRKEIVEYARRARPGSFRRIISIFKISDLKNEALAALIEIASVVKDLDAYQFIHDYTGSVDEFVREKAFQAMACFGLEDNEMIFEKALFDPSRAVRTVVLACFGPGSGDGFLEKAQVLSKDPDEDVRLALTLAFGASGLIKFKLLISEMLDDPSLKVVAGAFISLASLNDPMFLEVFYSRKNIREIKDEIKNISEDRHFTAIIEDIRGMARNSRNLEVDLLFAKNEREYADELIKMLKETLDPVIRLKAVEMLKIIATEEFFTSILSIMKKDPYAEIRIQAMDVVAATGRTDEVISALSAMLADPSLDVRVRAAELLGKHKNPKALEALLHVLDTTDRQFREAVTTSLSGLLTGEPEKVAELVRSVPEAKTRKIGMTWLMGKTGRQGSIKFLVTLLGDNDPDVRASAVGALAKFGKKQIANHLEHLIYDPNERVRAAAVNAVTAIGGRKAFDIVKNALQDIDSFVRVRAAIGLAKLDLKETTRILEKLAKEFPEFNSYLRGVLCASGSSYPPSSQMDEITVTIVDELCHKEDMIDIFRQSPDKGSRLHAFRVLALTDGYNAELLQSALKDPVPEIRREAKKYCVK
ncbi:MAG: HEAT repeat domain-containing protein [Nitrospiraceae bacterium]|nr:MAG: HEAT repeat domain-containing protein [Nitrospiraceae bacterium]